MIRITSFKAEAVVLDAVRQVAFDDNALLIEHLTLNEAHTILQMLGGMRAIEQAPALLPGFTPSLVPAEPTAVQQVIVRAAAPAPTNGHAAPATPAPATAAPAQARRRTAHVGTGDSAVPAQPAPPAPQPAQEAPGPKPPADPVPVNAPIAAKGVADIPLAVLNAPKLRDVLVYLSESGLKSADDLVKKCMEFQPHVACLTRIANLEDRVRRALEVMGLETGSPAAA